MAPTLVQALPSPAQNCLLVGLLLLPPLFLTILLTAARGSFFKMPIISIHSLESRPWLLITHHEVWCGPAPAHLPRLSSHPPAMLICIQLLMYLILLSLRLGSLFHLIGIPFLMLRLTDFSSSLDTTSSKKSFLTLYSPVLGQKPFWAPWHLHLSSSYESVSTISL